MEKIEYWCALMWYACMHFLLGPAKMCSKNRFSPMLGQVFSWLVLRWWVCVTANILLPLSTQRVDSLYLATSSGLQETTTVDWDVGYKNETLDKNWNNLNMYWRVKYFKCHTCFCLGFQKSTYFNQTIHHAEQGIMDTFFYMLVDGLFYLLHWVHIC